MQERLSKLISIAGWPISPAVEIKVELDGRLGDELAAFLASKKGFYAFESALHVFPAGTTPEGELDLRQWNDDLLWRSGYADLTAGFLFFAEDVFGCQFAIKHEMVYSFDVETGEAVAMADSLEGWATEILENYEFRTGYPLARQWQKRNGAIAGGTRLVPKRPFALGGEFSADNLYALDSVQGMRLRAELALQLRDLPDGATVNYRVVD